MKCRSLDVRQRATSTIMSVFVLLIWVFAPAVTAAPQVQVLDGNYVDQLSADYRQSCCGRSRLAERLVELDKQAKATVDQRTLFASQDGSWLFQSFVNNGLFKVVSAYQPHHPKAIVLKKGVMSLGQLQQALQLPEILSEQNGEYVLSYPLIIESGASLRVDSPLKLRAEAGAAIINLGTLVVQNTEMTGVGQHPAFRPFVIAWQGSETYIDHSSIRNLGYDAYLSGGITVARHASTDTGSRLATWIEVANSTFENMTSGLVIGHAQGMLINNQFSAIKARSIDISQSELRMEDNVVQGGSLDGIRVNGGKTVQLIRNKVTGVAGVGVRIQGDLNSGLVFGNQIIDNHGHGLQVDRSVGQPHTLAGVKIDGNVIAHNDSSGVVLNCPDLCELTRNIFIANRQYPVLLDNADIPVAGSTVIVRNQFHKTPGAFLKSQNSFRLIWGHNDLAFQVGLHTAFLGDIQSVQGLILEHTLKNKRIVSIETH